MEGEEYRLFEVEVVREIASIMYIRARNAEEAEDIVLDDPRVVEVLSTEQSGNI